jgi:hypothetical protein
MAICKLGALAFAAVLGSVLMTGAASAVPANGLAVAAKQNAGAIQEVRWIGGWRGVGWRGVGWRGVGWRGVGWRGVGWRGVGWRGVGWRAGWGRGLYAYAGPGWRLGWRRPALAAATVAAGVGLAAAAYNSSYYDNTYSNAYYAGTGWNPYYNQPAWSQFNSPYYAYAGPTWSVGLNPGWGWRGWGWRGWGWRGWY